MMRMAMLTGEFDGESTFDMGKYGIVPIIWEGGFIVEF